MDTLESDTQQTTAWSVKRFRNIFFVGVIGAVLSFTLLSKLKDNAKNIATKQKASPESILPELKPKSALVSNSPFFTYDESKRPVAEPVATSNLITETSVKFTEQPFNNAEKKVTPNFTIQLIGLNDKTRLDHFIETHQLHSQAQTIKTKRNGKDWYIVLYGEYAEREAALEAIQTLPSALKALDPWPRQLSEINS